MMAFSPIKQPKPKASLVIQEKNLNNNPIEQTDSIHHPLVLDLTGCEMGDENSSVDIRDCDSSQDSVVSSENMHSDGVSDNNCDSQVSSTADMRASTPVSDTSSRNGHSESDMFKNDNHPSVIYRAPSATNGSSNLDGELMSSLHSVGSACSTSTVQSQTDLNLYDQQIQVPIEGYEVMEQRSRFTVFKIKVVKNPHDTWFIFRRYTDFVRLNDKLEESFPRFRLALPPKRWFGDNYDKDFLDDRLIGLQAFLNNIICHRDVCNSPEVRDFLCIDDPPGPHESLEESRALCDSMQEEIYELRQDLQERDAKVALLEEELSLYRTEVANLKKYLTLERSMNRRESSSSLTEELLSRMGSGDGHSRSPSQSEGGISSLRDSPIKEHPES